MARSTCAWSAAIVLPAAGDVCNKVGTYLKALAARDNDVPFYVCLPSTTIDWGISDGIRDIPIEQRDCREVTHLVGKQADTSIVEIMITAADTRAINYAFDVTPARFITALITERAVVAADEDALAEVFPEHHS